MPPTLTYLRLNKLQPANSRGFQSRHLARTTSLVVFLPWCLVSLFSVVVRITGIKLLLENPRNHNSNKYFTAVSNIEFLGFPQYAFVASGVTMTKLFQLLVVYLCLVAGTSFGAGAQSQADADKVVALPGQPAVGFNLYAGNVNVSAGRELFYVFAQCSNDTPGNKPLVIWFNGGPGCSSLASGFARENGPFQILPGGTGLTVNEFAWNQEVNMIWLESPTGVGFSFSRLNVTENAVGGDTRTAEDAYNFLVGWLARFPQYQGRDFYITGESYAGHYVPQLAQVIVEQNELPGLNINLKGYMVGNPDIDFVLDYTGDLDYYHSHAMISTETYNSMKQNCDFSDCCSPKCNELFVTMYKEIGDIDYYSIYTDRCIHPNKTLKLTEPQKTNPPMMQRFRGGYDPCAEDNAEIYFNRPDVQLALHANMSGSIPYKWTMCSHALYQNWTDAPMSLIPTYHELIAAGLKIWVYSGDADSVVPVTSTRLGIEAMKLPIVRQWSPWYDGQQVGGRVVVYNGLTFVTVRGAGHQVPQLYPGRFLQLLKAFIAGEPLPGTAF